MNRMALLLSACVLVGVQAQAANNAGQLRFSGALVEAGCEMAATAAGPGDGAGRRLKLLPGVVLSVGRLDDACSDGSLPFDARYQPVPGITRTQRSPAGIVTITYR